MNIHLVFTKFNAKFSYAVANIGDIDGDGFNEVLQSGSIDVSAVSLSFGNKNVVGSLATKSILLRGMDNEDTGFGSSLSGIGDYNGDGLQDFLVSNPFRGNKAGTSYIIFGRTDISSGGDITTQQLSLGLMDPLSPPVLPIIAVLHLPLKMIKVINMQAKLLAVLAILMVMD